MVVEKDQSEKIIRTVCMIQEGAACGILAHVKNGVLTKVEPADYPEPKYRYMCSRGMSAPKIVYHPDRLKYPMKRVGERGEGKWQRISWEEALDTIATKFKDIRARYGPTSVSFCAAGVNPPVGAYFVLQRFASALEATWVGMDGMGPAGSAIADSVSFGVRYDEHFLWDHDDPRLVVIWGESTTVSGRYKQRHLFRNPREAGAKIVYISPIYNPTSAKADEWIPIRPGTDTALALGLINVVLSEELSDEPFLTEYTVGPFLVRSDNGLFLRKEIPDSPPKYMIWDTKTNKPQTYDTPGVAPALRGKYTVDGIECKPAFQLLAELVEQYPPEKVSEITEIPVDVIRKLALDYATRKPVISIKGIGISRTFYGDLTHRAIIALAAVTGNISKRPLMDAFMNMDWMGFTYPGGRVFKTIPYLQLYDTVVTEEPYPVKAIWISSINPGNSLPDHNKFSRMMSRMEFVVQVDLFMNETSAYADIVLPGATQFEHNNMAVPWAMYFGGHCYIQYAPKCIEPFYEAKCDLDMVNELAQRLGVGEFFNKNVDEYIEMLLSSGHPSLEGITLENLKKGPLKSKDFDAILFSTPSRRLEFYVENLKKVGQELPLYNEPLESDRKPLAQKYPLCLLQTHARNTQHSELHNIAVVKDMEPERTLSINPVDAEKRGIQDGDMVVVFNDRGKVKLKARIYEGIKPGVVNVIEGRRSDFAEGSYQDLTGSAINPVQQSIMDPMGQMNNNMVEVRKAEEA